VIWCDGSSVEWQRLTRQLVDAGTFVRLAERQAQLLGEDMATGHQRAQRRASPSGVSSGSKSAVSQSDGAVAALGAAVVTTDDVDWLVGRLQAIVTASPAVWAGRGMTLLQLIVLHFISALAPATPTDLAEALDTKLPATSAMIDRLVQAGLVARVPDPQDRRRVQLSITAAAEPIVAGTDANTARRLMAVLHAMSTQTRRPLIDILIDTVRRSAK
jgi:DNA-binding MarR family transcriptional regulator